VRPRDDWARRGNNNNSGGAATAAAAAAAGGGVDTRDDEALTQFELSQRYSNNSITAHKAMLALDHNAIDYELVVQVREFHTLVLLNMPLQFFLPLFRSSLCAFGTHNSC